MVGFPGETEEQFENLPNLRPNRGFTGSGIPFFTGEGPRRQKCLNRFQKRSRHGGWMN